MAGRTKLTGGSSVAGERGGGREIYSPALALPREPEVPSRYRGLVILAVTLVVTLSLLFGAYQLVTSGQDFDPALTDESGAPAPAPS